MSTRITPYLCVRGAARALDFYREAFGAVETMRIAEPGGRIGHAEIEIGGAGVMLSDEYPDMGVKSPQTLGGSPVTLHVYLDDVDAAFARALAAGGKEVRPVADQFYGDRGGKLEDPFGHLWWIATRKEELSREEIEGRAAALYATEAG
jgi:PhnB protein